MLPFLQRKSTLAVAAVAIFLLGIGAGYRSYQRARESILASLVSSAQRCAAAFEPAELKRLAGTPADLGTPTHALVKDRLERLRAAQAGLRVVYILRCSPKAGRVVFLADSEPPGSKNLSRPGDEYPEAPILPGLQAIIATGEPATEGPLDDQFGPRLTGYAPIGAAQPGQPRDILGLDLPAGDWRRMLWTAALGTMGYIWIFLVLPLVAFATTRWQLEQRDALRNLTEAMEQSHSAVLIVDLERRIEYVTAGFCRQVGYSRRELIGREWRELQGPETPPELVADLVTTVRAGLSWSGEWFVRRKDGTLYPARAGVTPVKDRAGQIRSFVSVFEDMTEIRRTESVLREAKERAEAGDRAKGQFLATMSHEVRTPLNGIVGFTGLLLDTELTPEQQEFVETIRTSSETLIQLTGDILDYARIESGRLKLEPQPCDPRECVESALDLAAAPAVRKNIELLHWVDDSVPAAILADVNRLRQVLVNLVNNAVKFTPTGEVEVRVRARPAEREDTVEAAPADECVLEFSIRDTGIGIAPGHYAKIFRPFSQVDDSTTRRYGGTGLGLAICKNIVELMRGTMTFASELDRGSTFTFTIRVPVQAVPDTPPAAPPPLLNQRLAVVAENRGLRSELARLGMRLGAHTIELEPAALATAADWDLAIVDVSGPLALELASVRTARTGLPPEKIVALVPMMLPGEVRHALRPHFRLVLNKPLHHDMLFSLLAGATSASAPPFAPARPVAENFDLRVLIVEDNAVNQRLIQKVVTSLGCRWTAVENGRLALEELARAPADVVLMDLHMPEQDGVETTKKIRAGEAGPVARNVWIIALTADARDEQKARTFAAGANDYLTKPVRLPEIVAAFRRLVANSRV